MTYLYVNEASEERIIADAAEKIRSIGSEQETVDDSLPKESRFALHRYTCVRASDPGGPGGSSETACGMVVGKFRATDMSRRVTCRECRAITSSWRTK